ncbi:hypothetical protein ACOBR2_04980 [Telmatobacter bradus]|uniref:hypothetical protein n=1 Tax=Telmatobacter bradus TaxID=474953 RepID=UPI003B43AA22
MKVRSEGTHLTEEMLSDLLIGLGTAEAERHVADCAACRQQVEGFGADVALLGQTALAWSENRVAAGQAKHLTEEALDDVLIGMATVASEAHLAGCKACRARVEGFHADMTLLQQTATGWSRQRAAEMDQHPLWDVARKLRWASLGWGLAALLIAAVVAPLMWHYDNGKMVAGNVRPQSPQAAETEAQIAADNDLMRAVNVAINPGNEMPLGEFHHRNRSHPRQKARPE